MRLPQLSLGVTQQLHEKKKKRSLDPIVNTRLFHSKKSLTREKWRRWKGERKYLIESCPKPWCLGLQSTRCGETELENRSRGCGILCGADIRRYLAVNRLWGDFTSEGPKKTHTWSSCVIATARQTTHAHRTRKASTPCTQHRASSSPPFCPCTLTTPQPPVSAERVSHSRLCRSQNALLGQLAEGLEDHRP